MGNVLLRRTGQNGSNTDITRPKYWKEVGYFIQHGPLTEEERTQVVEGACYRAEEQDLIDFILPVLTEEDLLHVLPTLLRRCLWSAIARVLDRNVSDSLNVLILSECIGVCSGEVLYQHIIPSCARGQVDRVMSQLVDTEQWTSVQLLLDAAGDGVHTWSVGDTQVDSHLLRQRAEGRAGELCDGLATSVGRDCRLSDSS